MQAATRATQRRCKHSTTPTSYHPGHVQATRSVNVVQALLESITHSQPQPKFPPELIKFLAKVHSAAHVAIPLLQTRVMLFPADTRCFHALADLYRLVAEDDLLYGLWKHKCAAQWGFLAMCCCGKCLHDWQCIVHGLD